MGIRSGFSVIKMVTHSKSSFFVVLKPLSSNSIKVPLRSIGSCHSSSQSYSTSTSTVEHDQKMSKRRRGGETPLEKWRRENNVEKPSPSKISPLTRFDWHFLLLIGFWASIATFAYYRRKERPIIIPEGQTVPKFDWSGMGTYASTLNEERKDRDDFEIET